MDTAQRGMGLDWPTALDLIRRTAALARSRPGALLASGCGTDQLAPSNARTLDDVIRAYEEQAEAIEAAGSRLILMASRALVQVARGPDDYRAVYDRLLRRHAHLSSCIGLAPCSTRPWQDIGGATSFEDALEVALDVIGANADKVAGIKISLLDKDKEIVMRRRLPRGVRMFTGDDFNYPELIAGDEFGSSDALLGAFAAIGPIASSALEKLELGIKRHFMPESILRYRSPVICSAPPRSSTKRDRLPGLSEWPSGPFHHARSARGRAIDSSSCRGVSAG